MLNTYSIKVKLILIFLITSLVTPLGLLIYILLIENQAQELEQQKLIIKKDQQEEIFIFENSLNNTYSDILYVTGIVHHYITATQQKKRIFPFNKSLKNNINFTFKSALSKGL